MRLDRGSPIIDQGADSYVVTDTTDVNDEDGTTEVTPWDMAKLNRIIVQVDIGAFERCVGDLDNDNSVGLSDLTLFLSSFGEDDCAGTPLGYCLADLDRDNDVDLSDLTLFLSMFGTNCKGPQQESLMSGGGSELVAWLRSASEEEIIAWYEAGMPPIGDR